MTDRDSPTGGLLESDRGEIALLGWLLLLPVVLVATLGFGAFLWWYGIDDLLAELRTAPARHSGLGSLVAIIEVALIPLTAMLAGWTRLGAERIQGLRNTWIGPWLPLLMAASIAGLATYTWWTIVSPHPGFGSDEFGWPRLLGGTLVVALTIIWLPLFPRVVAILSGMIAGPIVVALIGYTIFDSILANSGSQSCNSDVCGLGAVPRSAFAAQFGFFVLLGRRLSLWWAVSVGVTTILAVATGDGGVGVLWVVLLTGWSLVGLSAVAQLQARPATCFVVCALVAGGLAVSGARF